MGLVIYRPKDIAGTATTRVESHFVLRRPDAMWLDGDPLTLPKGAAAMPSEIPISGHLVLRYGSAAVGVFLPWLKAWAPPGGEPGVKLVDDGNPWNCLRLTIDHGRPADLQVAREQVVAGAFILVRVGSGLKRDADFDAWRKQFEAPRVTRMECSDKRFRYEVQCKDGPLSISADAPWDASAKVHIVPQPCQGVLEIDGREAGRPLLTAVEPLCSIPPNTGPLACIAVPAGRSVYWEAESGLILPGMEVIEDATASGRRCVGQGHSDIGEPSGTAVWSLAIQKPGRYWLWARARSGDANHGKFEFRVLGEDGAVIRPAEWLLRSPGTWQWKPLEIGGQGSPVPLELPKGICRIALQTRQSGTQIDRLMLTDDPQRRP